MSIQERDYMSEREKQREFADKYKLEDPNNKEHWDLNINKPGAERQSKVTRPASYNDVLFDESDTKPKQDSMIASLVLGISCFLGLVVMAVFSGWIIGTIGSYLP
jgi:hypothetical protein